VPWRTNANHWHLIPVKAAIRRLRQAAWAREATNSDAY
jgi:hypothetical protein